MAGWLALIKFHVCAVSIVRYLLTLLAGLDGGVPEYVVNAWTSLNNAWGTVQGAGIPK